MPRQRVAALLLAALTLLIGRPVFAAETPAPAASPAPVLETKTLSLQEAVALAVKNNPSVEIAGQEVVASRGQVIQATSALFPQVSASIGRTTPIGTSSAFQSNEASWATNVQLRQPLYTWGALGKGVRAARALLDSTQGTYLRTQDQISFLTRQAYYSVLTGQESVRVQQSTLAAAQEHRRIAGLRFEAGVAPQYDVLAADARVARVQQVLAAAQGGLSNAWAGLSRVMGVDVPADTVLTSPRPEAAVEAPLDTLIGQAVENRADVQAARAQVAVREAQFAVARTGNLPSFGLTVNYSWLPKTTIGLEEGGEPITISQSGGSILLGATWNIFTAGRVHGETVTAEARLRQAEENVRSTQLQAEEDVKTAYAGVQSAQAQVDAARKEVTAAQEAYRIAQVRYQEGVSTSVEVLDAQTNLGDAENRLNDAIAALNIAVAQLELAVGASTAPAAELGSGPQAPLP